METAGLEMIPGQVVMSINRNFDFMWEEGKEYNGKSGGESAASEVETQLIQKFMEEHPMDALASLHAAVASAAGTLV